jgi:hypothetical protein
MRRPILALLPLFVPLVVVGTPATARAGVAWGDASLKADDVRIEIDPHGRAAVIHTIGIHVAAKRFRAFTIDGVDDNLEAPSDEATVAGRDGPGWPVDATDAKGARVEAFVEPTKEPRKLRVRFGAEGVQKGDYTLRIRYFVDLAKAGAFTRDGAMLRFTWGPPHWPEGYDSGHILFALPPAPTEPKVALSDSTDGTNEGAAIVALHRGPATDELELTRPHVPHADDARWIVKLDPKALPEVSARLGADPTVAAAAPEVARRTLRGWSILGAGAALLGLALFLALRRRERDAARGASARGIALRPLVSWSLGVRSVMFGALATGAVMCSATRHPFAAAVALVAALALGALRPPRPAQAQRRPGRWLAVPEQALVRRARAPSAPFDPGTPFGLLVLVLVLAAIGVACAFLARTNAAMAAMVAMHALLLVPLFGTGRAAQLPPELGLDAWPRLAPIARALAKIPGQKSRLVARVVRGSAPKEAPPSSTRGVDEVRIRIDPTEKARAAGLIAIEIGCALVHGVGSAALVPELLVRMESDESAARLLEARLSRATLSATFSFSAGREQGERVLSIRPAFTSPAGMRCWVEWAQDAVVVRAPASAVQAAAPATRALRPASMLPEGATIPL